MNRIHVAILAFAACASLRADVRCPSVFGDHMVLQRDRPVAVWGEAAPSENVTVEFAGQSKTVVADIKGAWRTALDPLSASTEPRSLTIRGDNTLTFTDVLVGEVWFCSGQSNMEKQLGKRGGQKPTDNYEEETRQANHPLLRLFQVPHHGKPSNKITGLVWVPCTPETVAKTEFSAAGYYFGRELLAKLGVPIGLIHSSFGGTQIEAWTPPGAFDRVPGLTEKAMKPFFAWVKGVQATELYQSMVAPFVPYTVRGFLWYQGEANLMTGDDGVYTDKMRVLVESWREVWNAPDTPFLYVLIAPFNYSKWDSFPCHLTREALPQFWEAQASALSIPNTGMIVITDLAGDATDIHPTNKLEVGRRLARLALSKVYVSRAVLAESPRFTSLRPLDGGKFELTFANAGTGLASRDGQPLTYFTLAGENRQFHPAEAQSSGDKIVVSSPAVSKPVAVRFGWDETANPNLVNSAGLPAIPFRTDKWPVKIERPAPPKPAAPTTPEKQPAPAVPAVAPVSGQK